MCASSPLVSLPTLTFSSESNLLIGHQSTGKYKQKEIFKQAEDSYFRKNSKFSIISAPCLKSSKIRSQSIYNLKNPSIEYNLSDISDFELSDNEYIVLMK